MLAFYKESFICLLPLAVAIVFLEYWRKCSYNVRAIVEAIKKYWLFTIILALVGVIEVGIILFGVGTNGLGYVGVDSDIGLYQYTVIWGDCFKGPLKWYVLFGIIMIAVMLTRINRWKDWLTAALEDMEIIMWYSPEHRHYIYEPQIDFSEYDVQQVGTLVVAIRK